MWQITSKKITSSRAQKTFKAVERATRTACGLNKIAENFDDKTGVHLPSTEHSYRNAEKDQNDMIHDMIHSSFPHLPKAPSTVLTLES